MSVFDPAGDFADRVAAGADSADTFEQRVIAAETTGLDGQEAGEEPEQRDACRPLSLEEVPNVAERGRHDERYERIEEKEVEVGQFGGRDRRLQEHERKDGA